MVNYGNGVWIVEDSGSWVDDPETLDITDFGTEGDDNWSAIYTSVKNAPTFNADYEDIPGFSSIDMSIEEGHDLVKVTGTYQGATFDITKAKEDALQLFFRNHSALDDNDFYLVKRYTTDSYKLFPDASRTQKKYMKCRFSAPPESYIDERVLSFSFTVRSMW